MMAITCDNCDGVSWVCECHIRKPWLGSDRCGCGGAGMPCPVCNDIDPALHPRWPAPAHPLQKEIIMRNPVELVLCEPPPFFVGVNGHLSVTDGSSVWIVVVTCEALRATASPPEASMKRLLRYADLYVEMAEVALERGEDADGKIWIFERDMLARRTSTPASFMDGRAVSI